MSLIQNSTLKSIKISGEIYDSFGQFDVEQIYISTNQNPLEMHYRFALDNNSIITNITLQIGDKKLYGIINEKYQNRLNYERSIENKQTALTLEKNCSGNYTLKIGNIEPNNNIIVKYTYITYLKIVNSSFIYNLPTNIAPKYTQNIINNITTNKLETDKLEYNLICEYDFNINIAVKSANIIKNIDCNKSDAKLNKISDYEYIINTHTTPKDGDFIITFDTELKPCAYKYKNYYAINFNFPVEEYKSDLPKSYSIIVDRSGSMDGSKMNNAKEALKLFVSSLPENSYFNIISFGSTYTGLYQNSVKYSDKSIKKALEYINNMNADMGGTELYKCLEDCIKQNLNNYENKIWLSDSISKEYEQIIIILTDGQVTGSSNLTNMLSNYNDKKFRIFTLGIGNDSDKNELENIANHGFGVCRMSFEAKNIADNVIDILDYTNKIYYKNIKYNNDVVLKCAYPNVFSQAFIKINDDSENIILKSNDKEFTINLKNIEKGKIISQLYIDYIIKNKLINHDEIIKNSVKYSLLTDDTSFFLYSNDKINTEGELEQEIIKHYDSTEYDSMEYYSNFRPETCVALDTIDFSDGKKFYKQSKKSKSIFSFSPVNSRTTWISKNENTNNNENLLDKTINTLSKGINKLFGKQNDNNTIDNETKNYNIKKLRQKYNLCDEEDDDSDNYNDSDSDNYDKKENNISIIDYKLADGSFRLDDKLIKLCNYEISKFYELSSKLNIIPKYLINYIVLDKLENLKENKYKLIIKNLIEYLKKEEPDNYIKNYNDVKNFSNA